MHACNQRHSSHAEKMHKNTKMRIQWQRRHGQLHVGPYDYNLIIGKAEAGRWLQFQDMSELYSEFEANMGSNARPCLKQQQQQQKREHRHKNTKTCKGQVSEWLYQRKKHMLSCWGFYVPMSLSYHPFTDIQRDFNKKGSLRTKHVISHVKNWEIATYIIIHTEIQTGGERLRSQRYNNTKTTRKTLVRITVPKNQGQKCRILERHWHSVRHRGRWNDSTEVQSHRCASSRSRHCRLTTAMAEIQWYQHMQKTESMSQSHILQDPETKREDPWTMKTATTKKRWKSDQSAKT